MYTISEWLGGSTREIEEKFIHASLFTVPLTHIYEELVTLRKDAQCKNVVQTSFCCSTTSYSMVLYKNISVFGESSADVWDVKKNCAKIGSAVFIL